MLEGSKSFSENGCIILEILNIEEKSILRHFFGKWVWVWSVAVYPYVLHFHTHTLNHSISMLNNSPCKVTVLVRKDRLFELRISVTLSTLQQRCPSRLVLCRCRAAMSLEKSVFTRCRSAMLRKVNIAAPRRDGKKAKVAAAATRRDGNKN